MPGFNGSDIERIDRADIGDSRKVPGRRVRNVDSNVPAKRITVSAITVRRDKKRMSERDTTGSWISLRRRETERERERERERTGGEA